MFNRLSTDLFVDGGLLRSDLRGVLLRVMCCGFGVGCGGHVLRGPHRLRGRGGLRAEKALVTLCRLFPSELRPLPKIELL